MIDDHEGCVRGKRGPEVNGVIFDFGNVLYAVDYPRMARTLFGERADSFLGCFVGSALQLAYETGRAGLSEVLRGLRRAGFPVSRNTFLEAYLSIFDPIPGVDALVAALAEFRPLGLLSNTSREHARLFIERTPEFGLFKSVAYSFEIGQMKPAAATYHTVADRLGLPPAALAYTDDVQAYADAATALGMAGIPFRGAPDLRQRLVELGFDELRGRRA